MEDRLRNYKGKDIVVHFSPLRCIHVGECTARLARVFDTSRRPWVKPDAAGADEVAEVILYCPTGALHFTRLDGGEPEAVPDHNEITAAADGPLHLSGDIELYAPDGTLFLKDTRVSLCRCGASKFKPLCDESHAKIEFREAGELCDPDVSLESVDSIEPGQPLRVRFYSNDSYLIEGPFTLRSTDGSQAAQVDQASLCSCGRSLSKPFCDGSHRDITG